MGGGTEQKDATIKDSSTRTAGINELSSAFPRQRRRASFKKDGGGYTKPARHVLVVSESAGGGEKKRLPLPHPSRLNVLVMALDALRALGTTPDEVKLYRWCAQYCTFRDDRQPTKAVDLPVVLRRENPWLVRHAFMEDGQIKLIVANRDSLSVKVELSKVTFPSASVKAGRP